MTVGGPRSAKGIDPRARELAEGLARQSGLSLSEWLTEFLAEEGPEDAVSQDFFNTPAQPAYLETPRTMATAPSRYEAPEHPADEVGRVTQALDRLSARIEAAEQRASAAIGGVDATVRQVISRLEVNEREQTAVAARFEGAVQDVQHEQVRMTERVRKIEADAQGPRSAEAMRSLEAALGKVAGHLYEGEGRTQAAIADVRARMDHFEAERTDPGEIVEAVVSRLAARLEAAENHTTGALKGLQQSFAALDSRLNSVEGGTPDTDVKLEQLAATLAGRVDAARAEMAERMSATVDTRFDRMEKALSEIGGVDAARAEMAERMSASADTRFDRMEKALSEMGEHVRTAETRSTQAIERMGREVVEIAETLGRRVQTVEHRNADAIEQVGGEVARIALAVESKLGRADSAQAQALEKLGVEIARITERLSERIANSERRNAQAIDDVGEQMARVTERISQRHDRTSSDLADRIQQSEERTAKLLEEAREKLEKLNEHRKAVEAAAARPAYDADEALFADDPFPGFHAPAAATAPFQTPIAATAAFPPQPFRQPVAAAYSAPVAYGPAEPVTAFRPRTPEPAFSQEDFDAASNYTVGNLALDTREEALFAQDEETALAEPEPELAPAIAAEEHDDEAAFTAAFVEDAPEPPATDWAQALETAPESVEEPERLVSFAQADAAAFDDFDDEDSAAPVVQRLAQPAADDDFEDPFEDHFDDTLEAADTTLAEAPLAESDTSEPAPLTAAEIASIDALVSPAPVMEDDLAIPSGWAPTPEASEPQGPLSTREVVERARAAARAASPSDLAPRRKSPAEPPASSTLFAAPGFGKADKRAGVSPVALGLLAAASVGVAFVGFTMLQTGSQSGLPDWAKQGVDVVNAKLVGATRTATANAPKGVTSVSDEQPQVAVALAIKPMDGAAAAPLAAAAAGAKPAEDLASVYSAAVAKVAANDKTGMPEIRRIANLGYAPAQFYLAKQYEGGTGGLKKDLGEARRWTERAAEGGYAKAMHNLGLYYFEGTGGPRNTTTAAQWFRRAADLGLVDSQFNLGRLYENGSGVSLNPAEAYKWFLVASRSGDGDSQVSATRVRSLLTADARAAAERSATAFHPGVSSAAVSVPAPAIALTDVITAQRALSALGYYQGPADGVTSPALRLAIAAYQRDQGLPSTGATDATTVGKLASISR